MVITSSSRTRDASEPTSLRTVCQPNCADLTEDDIVWKHTASGIYSAASAYKAQFLKMVLTPLDKMVWKAWAPQKSSSSFGWRYKTEFGLPIVWQNVGGPTVVSAHFA